MSDFEIVARGEEAKKREGAKELVVRVVESEKWVLKETEVDPEDGSVKGTFEKEEIRGEINVENTGTEDRIWNSDLYLENIENTSLEDEHIYVSELEPGEVQTYEYDLETEEPLVEVDEKILTYLVEGATAHYMLVKGIPIATEINIALKNPSAEAMATNLSLTKTLPEELGTPSWDPESGKVTFADGSLNWVVDKLGAGESTSLKISYDIVLEEATPISLAGGLTLTYEAEAGTLSGLRVKEIDGLSSNFFYIDKDEREDDPEKWDITVYFDNESEFPVILHDAEIYHMKPDGTFDKTADLTEEVEIAANTTEYIVFDDLIVESSVIPIFEKKIDFTVGYSTSVNFTGEYHIEPTEIPVAYLTGNKEFDKTRLDAYRPAEVMATIEASNVGSCDFDEIVFEDTIPAFFNAPSDDDISILMNGVDAKEKGRPDISIDEANRKIRITFENLKDSKLGSLGPEGSFKLSYPLTADKGEIKPTPPVLEAPVEIMGNVFPPFPEPISAEFPAELLTELIVRHITRRLRVGKEVRPTFGEKGSYTIQLMFHNRIPKTDELRIDEKEGFLEKVVITDIIPDLFTLPKESIETVEPVEELIDLAYSIVDLEKADPLLADLLKIPREEAKDYDVVVWELGDVEPDQRIVIQYQLIGSGDEYRPRKAQAFISGELIKELEEAPTEVPETIVEEEEEEEEEED